MSLNSNQEEEEGPSAKKRKLEGDEVVAALIQKPKLLSLNPDTLEEMVPHLDRTEAAEILRKFLTSGKEPFRAALRYLSHVSSVEVRDGGLSIRIKRFPLRKCEKTNGHFIPYDFEYMDKILVVLAKFNKDLIITGSLHHGPGCDKGRRILAYLAGKDLERVHFQCCTIPDDYVKFFKNECSFKEVKIYLCGTSTPSLTDFLTMKSLKHCITAHFQRLYKCIIDIPEGVIFPTVEHLTIDPCCECELREGESREDFDHFMFTKDEIKHFFDSLVEHFPNLQTLDASFYSLPYTKADLYAFSEESWDTVYAEMVKFTPPTFCNLPSHLKGSIKFHYGDLFTKFNHVMDELDENPGVEIVDNYSKEPSEPSKLIKKFDIHDGLTFKYELGLHGDTLFLNIHDIIILIGHVIQILEALKDYLSDSSDEEEVLENEESEKQNSEEESENEDGEKDNGEESSENEGSTLD